MPSRMVYFGALKLYSGPSSEEDSIKAFVRRFVSGSTGVMWSFGVLGIGRRLGGDLCVAQKSSSEDWLLVWDSDGY